MGAAVDWMLRGERADPLHQSRIPEGMNAITHNFLPKETPSTRADFTYRMTPSTVAIVNTNRGRRSVTNDIEAVLR